MERSLSPEHEYSPMSDTVPVAETPASPTLPALRGDLFSSPQTPLFSSAEPSEVRLGRSETQGSLLSRAPYEDDSDVLSDSDVDTALMNPTAKFSVDDGITEDIPAQCGTIDRVLALTWAGHETHTMMFDWLATRRFRELSRNEQLASPWLRYNIFYWLLLFIPVVLVMMFGRLVHSFFGQGGPVRPDEVPHEKEARVQWMYTLSGWFVQMILYDATLLVYYAGNGTLSKGATLPPHRPQWEVIVLHMIVSAAYIGGNVVFIRAMRLRNKVLVRFSIAANVSFGIALLAAFIWYTATRENATGVPKTLRILRLICIAGFLACQMVAGYIYSRLWHLYDGEEHLGSTKAFMSKLFMFAFAVILIGGVFAAIADPTFGSYVWSALIGF